ncbi:MULTISPECIES: M15 family metallopeptidase [unclassified Exiguobacterium]|uniref:M15 family metallopeptidase n=1 Tax=unclassified Exiguobacterium TaxID=2644629 RepID=UPI000B592AE2|nr:MULTISPECIES: M15 family metallopeptidase [unclassified Exiguobacterium]ASI35272.1 peptidoglycan-binding protein [Exiguobacterium sp. N4-1P]ASI37285.1 peptidoglycan-binding protein [Exiguobacterium sp. N4-1P]
MTISTAWLLERADRKLSVKGMDADVVTITRSVIKELAPQQIYVGVAQSYRTKQEQDALYAVGRTRPGKIVTYARGGQSNHNFGVAVDLFCYSSDGTRAEFLAPPDKRLSRIVAAMKQRQMEWGGDWTPFRDYPHFQLFDAVNGKKKPHLAPLYLGRALAKGSQDKETIRLIQMKLRLPASGRFDDGLTRAVKDFQRQVKITVDGIVGPVTWRHLFQEGRG